MKKTILLVMLFLGLYPSLDKCNRIIFINCLMTYSQDPGSEGHYLGLDYNLDCGCWVSGTLNEVTITAITNNPGLNSAGMAALGLTFVEDVPPGLLAADIALQEVPDLDLVLDGISLYYILSSSNTAPNQTPPAQPAIPQAADLPWVFGESPGPDWTWKGRDGVPCRI